MPATFEGMWTRQPSFQSVAPELRSTKELIELEATEQFPLGTDWAESMFYAGAQSIPGGTGYPVMQVKGTAPLQLEVFHRPPQGSGGSYGAAEMTCTRMSRDNKMVYYDATLVKPIADKKTRAISKSAGLPTLLLVCARARIVPASSPNTSIFGAPLQKYLQTKIEHVADVRPLWVRF